MKLARSRVRVSGNWQKTPAEELESRAFRRAETLRSMTPRLSSALREILRHNAIAPGICLCASRYSGRPDATSGGASEARAVVESVEDTPWGNKNSWIYWIGGKQAETVGELHEPRRLGVALRPRHAEIIHEPALGVRALLLADDAERFAFEPPQSCSRESFSTIGATG